MFQQALIAQLERALGAQHPEDHQFQPMDGDARVCGICAWTPTDHPQHVVLEGILRDLKDGSMLIGVPISIVFIKVPIRPRRSIWSDLFGS